MVEVAMKGSLLGLKQKEIGVGLVFHKPTTQNHSTVTDYVS